MVSSDGLASELYGSILQRLEQLESRDRGATMAPMGCSSDHSQSSEQPSSSSTEKRGPLDDDISFNDLHAGPYSLEYIEHLSRITRTDVSDPNLPETIDIPLEYKLAWLEGTILRPQLSY